MFSVMSVCLSVCLSVHEGRGGSMWPLPMIGFHLTGTPTSPNPAPQTWDFVVQGPPDSNIWWPSLDIYWNVLTLGPPLVLTSGGYWSTYGWHKRAVRSALVWAYILNRIRRSTWNTLGIHTLKFYIFLFTFEAKIHIPKGKSTRLYFNKKMIWMSKRLPRLPDLIAPKSLTAMIKSLIAVNTHWQGAVSSASLLLL